MDCHTGQISYKLGALWYNEIAGRQSTDTTMKTPGPAQRIERAPKRQASR